MRVLMIGATGRYAGLVLPELKRRGIRVRALVRTRDAERAARERGADETALGDLEDARCLISAAVGADGVFHIGPAFAPRESQMGITMVEAARAAGVSKFVYSGVMHPSLSKLSNHAVKRPVEEALYDSGLTYTVLQPAIFMQTLETGWSWILQSGRFAQPFSRRMKTCYVDYRDVAEAAAMALASEKLDNGTFELCSPGMYTRSDIANLMSEALGMKIEPGELTFDEWADRSRIPEGPMRDGLQRMYAEYNQHGFAGGNPLVLRAVLGREPRTLKQFLQELSWRGQKAA